MTRTLLFIGEGGDPVIGTGSHGWGTKFMAYDNATGEVLWSRDLDAGVTSAPMTYLHEGRQYIVVGSEHAAEWVALAVR